MEPGHTQLEMRLRADPKAIKLAADVQRLITILRGRGWCTAKQLVQIAAGMNLTERRLRQIAAASDAAIVSWPGSPGYTLFDETTEADIDHAIKAHGSQVEEMQTRLTAILRRHHSRRLVGALTDNNPVQGP